MLHRSSDAPLSAGHKAKAGSKICDRTHLGKRLTQNHTATRPTKRNKKARAIDPKSVQWILPTTPSQNNNEVTTEQAYSQALYGRDWNELTNNRDERLDPAPVQSPMIITDRDHVPQYFQEHDNTQNIRRLYVQILKDIDNGELFGRLSTAFETTRGDMPIIITSSLGETPNPHPRLMPSTIDTDQRFSV